LLQYARLRGAYFATEGAPSAVKIFS